MNLDKAVADNGTRFRIFPQPRSLDGFTEPETICVSVTTDKIEPGPADDRMYVVDAINKNPYNYPYLPPHTGQQNPPVEPDPQTGHFDHLDVDSREFKAAQMYATVRRTLDIWEDYFGKTISWHFGTSYARMELVPLIHWDNAHSGFGFLEFGFGRTTWGGLDLNAPYCMNFDVLAHELGHSIIFGTMGFPTNQTWTPEYAGHGEAAGDLVAIVAALHSNKVVDYLLNHSSGNLFTVNELDRIGELDNSREIRRAFNYERMSTVGTEEHDLSMPLTGAIFDILVEVFQKELVQASLITQELADQSYHGPDATIDDSEIQKAFNDAYSGNEADFKISLLKARDYVGELLATTWDQVSSEYFSFADFGLELLSADFDLNGGEHQDTIRDCFAWREIGFPDHSVAYQTHRVVDYARHVVSAPEMRSSGQVERTATASKEALARRPEASPKKNRQAKREVARKNK